MSVVACARRYERDESNKDVGTSMFKKQGGGGGGGGSGKFTAMKTAEFLPNAVLAFAPCTSSWHGVAEEVVKGEVVRDTIQGFVRPLSKPSGRGGSLARC